MEIFGIPAILIIIVACVAWATIKYDRKKKIEFAWNSINDELILMMQKRLGTEFKEFRRVCVKIGLLNNFLLINEMNISRDIKYACFLCASATVSAANHYGSLSELVVARHLANWSIKLCPIHVPALMCLLNICQLEGDEKGADEYFHKIETVKNRIRNTPDSHLQAYERTLLRMFES